LMNMMPRSIRFCKRFDNEEELL